MLIVPPAGLVGNWESELRNAVRPALQHRHVASDARDSNPFAGSDSDLVIVSVDTLAGERMFARLREPGVAPYDLVVFDEAHKLSARLDSRPHVSAHRSLPSRRRLWPAFATATRSTALAGACRHLLLLTATPHMGKDYPYYCLWRLLEPEVLSTKRPSMRIRPMRAAAISSAAPRRRWSHFDGAGSIRSACPTR